MFPASSNPSKLISSFFILGTTLPSSPPFLSLSTPLTPEILFSYPFPKDTFPPTIHDFIYPTTFEIQNTPQPPQITAFTLTNEKGIRSYIYSLKLHEQLPSQTTSPLYIPYSICIWTSLPYHNDKFKSILLEIHTLLKTQSTLISPNTLMNFKYIELLHLMYFLTNITLPPHHTRLTLNLHFSSIDFYFPGLHEIPNNNSNHIKILFDCLDINTVIKLWCSLLCEKHIIIIGTCSYLLFAICEALLSLIFPFKWLHTYIPVLPSNQLDYLESPTPYLMGVLSYVVDYEYLNTHYSSHVICDVTLNEINKNGVSVLSRYEEMNIRKRISLMKNAKLFTLDNIDTQFNNTNSNNKVNGSSFGENVSEIFFDVFKVSLHQMVKYLKMSEKVFNVDAILDEVCLSDMREFWEKISATVAFENFIIGFNSLDESNSRIFKNISKYDKGEGDKDKVFKVQLNLPTNVNYIIDELKNSNMKEQERSAMKIDFAVALGNICNCRKTLTPSEKKIKWKRKCKERNDLNECYYSSCDVEGNNEFIISTSFNNINNNDSGNNIHQQQYMHDTAVHCFSVYMNTSPGLVNMNFISFANFVVNVLHDTKHIYNMLFTTQVKEILLNKDNNNYRINDISLIPEQDKESISSQYIQDNSITSSCDYDNNSNVIKDKDKPIIYYNSHTCSQFYQYLAFILMDNIHDNNLSPSSKDEIFKLFEHSSKLNSKSFSRVKFFQFLDNFTYNELLLLSTPPSTTTTLPSTTSLSVHQKLILLKLKKMSKLKTHPPPLTTPLSSSIHSNNTIDLISSSNTNTNNEYNFRFSDPHISKDKDTIQFLSRIRANIDLKRMKSSKGLTTYKHTLIRSSTNELLLNNSTSSRISNADNYEYRTDGEKLIEMYKHNNDSFIHDTHVNVKLTILNSNPKYTYTNKDPLRLMEDIAVGIYALLIKTSLPKFHKEMLTKNTFINIASSTDFTHIKDLIYELQVIQLTQFIYKCNKNHLICFWLNCYNFLTIYAIIYKKEVLRTYYEWYKFLKNTFFNIGGFELSLYEIENCLLRSQLATEVLYGETFDFAKGDKRKELKMKELPEFVQFCMSIPTKTAPNLQIYFPNRIDKQIAWNVRDYFNRSIKVDVEKGVMDVQEYVVWVDDMFLEDVEKYAKVCTRNFIRMVKKYGKAVSVVKFEWEMWFGNCVL